MSEDRFRKAIELIDAQECECSENHGFMPACPHVIASSALAFDEESWASFVDLGEDEETKKRRAIYFAKAQEAEEVEEVSDDKERARRWQGAQARKLFDQVRAGEVEVVAEEAIDAIFADLDEEKPTLAQLEEARAKIDQLAVHVNAAREELRQRRATYFAKAQEVEEVEEVSEEEQAERERRNRILEKMVRDAEDSGLAEKLGKVTPDDVVQLQNQRDWAEDIARGLDDLRSGKVAVWNGKLMARLRRTIGKKGKPKK